MSAKSTRRKGQSIIETVVGIMFLVPIVLFLFDIAVLVLCNTANDNLAKSACRAAASAVNNAGTGDATSAYNAAKQVADSFATSAIIGKSSGGSFLTGFSFNKSGSPEYGNGAWPGIITGGQSPPPEPNSGQVACITSMKVTVPVPFPFLPDKWDFQSKDVEPIVSIAP